MHDRTGSVLAAGDGTTKQALCQVQRMHDDGTDAVGWLQVMYDGTDARVVELLRAATAVTVGLIRAPVASIEEQQAWDKFFSSRTYEPWLHKPGNWELMFKQGGTHLM
jgi:hypothetical protein